MRGNAGHGAKTRQKKSHRAATQYIWHLLSQAFPPLMSFAQRQKRSSAKSHVFFQCRLGTAQLEGHNIISIAATGSGKTLSYLITIPFSGGKIIILVSALNVLGEQFVAEMEKAGYPAISVTAENDNDRTFMVCRSTRITD